MSRYDDQCVALREAAVRNRAPEQQPLEPGPVSAGRRGADPASGQKWRRALVSKRLHELRIVCCAEAPSSAPRARDASEKQLRHLKTLNPKFPFLVRAAEDKPYVVATYGMGHTETRDLDGLDEAAVERTFEELVALGRETP